MNITIIAIHFLSLSSFQNIDTLMEGEHGSWKNTVFKILLLPHELRRKKGRGGKKGEMKTQMKLFF